MEKKFNEKMVMKFYHIFREYHGMPDSVPKYMFDLVNHQFFDFDEIDEDQQEMVSKESDRFLDVPSPWIWDYFNDFIAVYCQKYHYTQRFADDILRAVLDGAEDELEFDHSDTGAYFYDSISRIDKEITEAYGAISDAEQNLNECADEVAMLRMWGFDPAAEYDGDDWKKEFLQAWDDYLMEQAKEEFKSWKKEHAEALEKSFA